MLFHTTFTHSFLGLPDYVVNVVNVVKVVNVVNVVNVVGVNSPY